MKRAWPVLSILLLSVATAAIAQIEGDLSVNISNFKNLDKVLVANGRPSFLWWGDSTGAYTVPWLTTLLTKYTTNGIQLASAFIGGSQWYSLINGANWTSFESQPKYYWVPNSCYAMNAGSNAIWGGPSFAVPYAYGNQVQIWLECSSSNGVANLYISTNFSTWFVLGTLTEPTAGPEGTILCTNFAVELGSYAVKLACTSGTFRWFSNVGVTQTNTASPILSVLTAPGTNLRGWTNMGRTNIGMILSNINPTVTFYQQHQPLDTYNNYTNYAWFMTNYAPNSDNCLIAGEITTPADEALNYPTNNTYQLTLFTRLIALSNDWAFIDCFSGTLSSWSNIVNLGFYLDDGSGIHLSTSGINFLGDEFGFRSQLASHWITAGQFDSCIGNIEGFEFGDCASFTSLTVSNGVATIADNAFNACAALTNLTTPGSITSIGASAFSDCTALTNISIGNGVATIEDNAFNYCPSLTSVTIPESVTNIGTGAFFGCISLTNVTIGNGVTSISPNAFYSCTNLTSVTIPAGFINIGEFAFYECYGLTNVYCLGNSPSADSSVFQSDNNATVYYLPGTTGWSAFSADTGLPAVLWKPVIQTGDGSFGLSNNQFGFNINWTSGQVIVVEACSNLANASWIPLQTNTLTSNSFFFSEPFQTNSAGHYFRIISL